MARRKTAKKIDVPTLVIQAEMVWAVIEARRAVWRDHLPFGKRIQLLQPGAQLIGSRQRLAHRRAAHRGHARAVRPPATSPSSRPQSAPGSLPA